MELSQISEVSERNAAVSFLNSSILDDKVNSAWKNSIIAEADKEKIEKLEATLKQKEDSIDQYKKHEEIVMSELEEYQNKINQYEVDLNYCVQQNKLAFTEIEDLKSALAEKDSLIERLESGKFKPSMHNTGKLNYKFYSELELFVRNILEKREYQA